MRKTLTHVWLQVSILCFAAVLAAPAAQAQGNVTELMTRMYSGPDEYYFFEADRKQVVDYKTDHIVRVCTGKSKHLVPLKVTYDGKTAQIASGDCLRVEAKKVFLEPAKRLDPNWTIRAEVETY